MNLALQKKIQQIIDNKTKPLGSLGRIEEIALQIAMHQQTTSPVMRDCSLTIFAADHGIAESGVSAFPQVVTKEMVLNFLRGGAAANVFAQTHNMHVQVVDAGVAGNPIDDPTLISCRIAEGTKNFLHEPSMSTLQCDKALSMGETLGLEASTDAVCYGEMGIANTSSASMLAHKICNLPLSSLVGAGTGLDNDGVKTKTQLLNKAAQRTADKLTAKEALIEYGGFEIAMMAGAMIGAAKARKIILVDGFIATSAAIVACNLVEQTRNALIFSHRSAENGHWVMLNYLDAKPLLSLELRLGEGTGAVLAWPLLKAATAMLTDMASFESANVSST